MMTKIVAEHAVSPHEWERYIRSIPYATYYHGYAWAELLQVLKPGQGRPDARLLEFEDGARVLLPMAIRRLYGLGWQHVLAAGGEYGGWLSEDGLSPSHHAALWNWLKTRNFVLRQNPFYPDSVEVPAWVAVAEDFTQAVRLKEPLTKGWSRGKKSTLNKAIRAGVEVREAAGDADWQGFVDTYHASLKRWGGDAQTVYDDSVFAHLKTLDSDHLRLWVALFDDKVVAGIICLYHGRQVIYWIGSLDAEYSAVRPAPLLMKTVMEHACEAGYEWFDFGPSGGLDGVEAFKAGFGAVRLPCRRFSHYASPWLRALKHCVSLARRVGR